MILIGQFDSPFVRRVGVALQTYGLAYEHRPWSTFSDADKLAGYNPLRRVPTLVMEDGQVLIESSAILDFLDESAVPATVMIPVRGPERRSALRICALATGLCDKMVSLVYERALHEKTSDDWISRCETQVADVLGVLEADRAAGATPFWFGDRPGHADVAVACALRFLKEAHPAIHGLLSLPALNAHSDRCEALPAFQAVLQPFLPPGRRDG